MTIKLQKHQVQDNISIVYIVMSSYRSRDTGSKWE